MGSSGALLKSNVSEQGSQVQWDTVSFLRFSSVINDITKRAYLYVEYFYNHGKITTKFKGRGKHNTEQGRLFGGEKRNAVVLE